MTERSAPQNSADRLVAATETLPDDRAFLRWLVVVCVVVLVAGASASYVLNPYGHFVPAHFAPRVTLDRDEKLAMWRALPNGADVVVVGSSHVKKFDPVCIAKLTGKTVFNFGVDGGNLDDFEAVFAILSEQHPPHQVLFGIDPTLLASTPRIERHTLWPRQFSSYVVAGFEERFDAIAEMLWSSSALSDDWAVLRRGHEHNRTQHLRADGFFETPTEDAEAATGTFDLDHALRTSSARIVPLYLTTNVDPKRLALLRGLLVAAKARGIEVVAFMPPLHPTLSARLAKDNNFSMAQRSLGEAVDKLASEGLVRYVPTSLAAYGTAGDFLDADHMNARNAARLTEVLYGQRGTCAVQ